MQTLPNEKIEKQGSYAGFLPRLVAFFIDWVIVSLGVSLVKGIFLSGLEEWSVMTMDILFSYSIIDILTWLLKISYFVISLYCTQTTIGKYLMKLKVVGAETDEISLFQILYREVVGRFLSSFIFIGYLIIIGDKEKAALHDKLADTRVVYSCNVKVMKKVVVTKVWNNDQAVQTVEKSSVPPTETEKEVKAESEQIKQTAETDSFASEQDMEAVNVNIEAEVMAVLKNAESETDVANETEKVDVAQLLTADAAEFTMEENVEEDV